MPADVEGFTRVWRDPAGKPAFYAEAWGATGGTGEYAWDKSGFRLICRAKTLLTFLEAQDACLVLLVKAQKYLKDAGTTDGKFAESTLLMTIMPSGGDRIRSTDTRQRAYSDRDPRTR